MRRRHARALLACSPVAADRAELGIQLLREALRWIVSGEPRVAVRAVEANRLGRLRALVPER